MLNKYFKLQISALNNFVNHKTLISAECLVRAKIWKKTVTLMLLSVCLKGDLELTFLIFFIYTALFLHF